MEEKFTWKAEIKFVGNVDEFNKLAEALEKLPVEISIPEWKCRPHHFAGCMPIPIDILLSEKFLEELAEDMPRIKIKYIRDINGGMRTPHFHLKDEVVLLDRAKFKVFAARVAHELAEKRAEEIEDYIEVMDKVGRLSATPITLP